MDKLKNALQKMYHAADSNIPDLAVDFFRKFTEFYKNRDDLEEFTKPIPDTLEMWDEIYARLVVLREGLKHGGEEENDKIEILNQLIDEAEKESLKRCKVLKECKSILAPQSIPYYISLTNINPNIFRPTLKKFQEKIGALENGHSEIKSIPLDVPARKLTKGEMFRQLRLLSFRLSTLEEGGYPGTQESRYEFDALYAAISQYYRQRSYNILTDKIGYSHSRMYSLNSFENCSLCWRFVPKRCPGDNKKPYCAIHA